MSDLIIENGVLVRYTGTEENIVIPDSVTKIGESVFLDCFPLEKILIPDSVTIIEDNAFEECILLKEIVIPDSVIDIGEYAFSGCTYLESVQLPASLRGIKESTFKECLSLKEIVIPDSVKNIGFSAFEGCVSLEKIVLPDPVALDDSVFKGCRSLTDENGFVIVQRELFDYTGGDSKVIVPDSVTKISGFAFEDCISLKEVVLPGSVTKIGSDAFGVCPGLTIHAPAGSYAEKYAKENDIPFESI